MMGSVYVRAKDINDAVREAESNPSIGLPDNAEYVDSSWEVNYDGAYVLNIMLKKGQSTDGPNDS